MTKGKNTLCFPSGTLNSFSSEYCDKRNKNEDDIEDKRYGLAGFGWIWEFKDGDGSMDTDK